MKRIYIVDGHPAARSLSRTLAMTYADSARAAGHEVRLTHLHDLTFDSDYGHAGYAISKPLEPDLRTFLSDLQWSEHLVLVAPMWWGGLPAKLKGLIDRSLLPGGAFDTRNTRLGMPTPLLGGRTARVVMTSDTPGWFLRLVYRNALIWQIRRQILGFIGIKPSRFTLFSGASHAANDLVGRWIAQIQRLAARAS